MPSKEIKELRQAGKLEEALAMAKAELDAQPDNIWCKRNISWVYYEFLKRYAQQENIDLFITYMKLTQSLSLDENEKMLFDNIAWQVGSLAFKVSKTDDNSRFGKLVEIFDIVKTFHYSKPSEGYSFLLKAFHKSLKVSDRYISFVDFWGLENLRKEDFEKEILPNGNELMAFAEQVYIAYSKNLLPRQNFDAGPSFDKFKVLEFIPKLVELAENYPQFQYPSYFIAKLLLSIGDKEHMLEHLLPFAKKKRNDFWVWEILAEAFANDPEKVFNCYCKALSCKSPEEMLVTLRQKMASILIKRGNFNEAKTEIELLLRTRSQKGYKIPNEVMNWQSQDWFLNARDIKSNLQFYRHYSSAAEALLFNDIQEETIFVDYVNTDKKFLNFIASESKFGYFKYDRFFRDVRVGDILKVRFQEDTSKGIQLYTGRIIQDETFKSQFFKDVEGKIRIGDGKSFGFLEDIYVHPSIVENLNLVNGSSFRGKAIRSFNKEKQLWTWKLIA